MRENKAFQDHLEEVPKRRMVAEAGNSSETSPSSGDTSSLVCRICYGGSEVGRLISPCLCTGTIRFVHLDCLNMWRLASSNPQSFYQCDQCKFRYSFKRAFYANILRSSLVLHMLTFLAFSLAVIICSYGALIMDNRVNNGEGWQSVFTDEFVARLVNSTDGAEVDPQDIKDTLASLNDFSWHGMRIAHFCSGFLLVGLSGFLTLGLFWVPVMGRDPGGAPIFFLIIAVIVGAIRVFFGIYKLFSNISGKVLQSAETMILEVGTSTAPHFHSCDKEDNDPQTTPSEEAAIEQQTPEDKIKFADTARCTDAASLGR